MNFHPTFPITHYALELQKVAKQDEMRTTRSAIYALGNTAIQEQEHIKMLSHDIDRTAHFYFTLFELLEFAVY